VPGDGMACPCIDMAHVPVHQGRVRSMQVFGQSRKPGAMTLPPSPTKGIHQLLQGSGFRDIMLQLATYEIQASAAQTSGIVNAANRTQGYRPHRLDSARILHHCGSSVPGHEWCSTPVPGIAG
jgi:hypothetical protein